MADPDIQKAGGGGGGVTQTLWYGEAASKKSFRPFGSSLV